MHRPPFADKLDDEMYYADPTHNQRLDILLHLTQYSDELLLAVGPEGIGKTTIINQFVQRAGESWKICRIGTHPMLDEEQLLLRISHGFHLPVDIKGFDIAFTNLKRRLEALLVTTQTVVLLVDNAHQFNSRILSLLLEISSVTHSLTNTTMRTILFGETSIKIQLAKAELEPSLRSQPQRKIDIPPFNEAHTGEYINHRLLVAGCSSATLFSETTMNKIFKQSGGIPGRISELAHNVLYDMIPLRRRQPRQPPQDREDTVKSTKMAKVATTLVVSLAIITLLLFQNQINELYSIGKKPPPRTDRGITKTRDKTTVALAIPKLPHRQENPSEPGPTLKRRATGEMSKSGTIDNAALDALRQIGNKPNRAGKPFQSVRQIKARPLPSYTRKEEYSEQATHYARTPAKATTQNGQHGIRDEPWILVQNPTYYTLQLVAGYQRSSIDHFIDIFPQLSDELAYFHSYNKGKGWHTLVYGVYPDYNTAGAAAKRLSLQLDRIKPWIRQIKSVQRDLKSVVH